MKWKTKRLAGVEQKLLSGLVKVGWETWRVITQVASRKLFTPKGAWELEAVGVLHFLSVEAGHWRHVEHRIWDQILKTTPACYCQVLWSMSWLRMGWLPNQQNSIRLSVWRIPKFLSLCRSFSVGLEGKGETEKNVKNPVASICFLYEQVLLGVWSNWACESCTE